MTYTNIEFGSSMGEGPRGGRGRPGRKMRGGPGFGGGPRFGGPGRRGGRRRRGDVRAAVLLLLEEESRNGYQLIQEIAERSGDVWRPSPGSIYPVLQQLEDEGLIAEEKGDSGRTFALTEAGRQLVEEQRQQLGTPWEDAGDSLSGPGRELMHAGRQVAMAARQVLQVGSPEQVARAATILGEARRSLYGILAEGDEPSEA
jgi:DNA-binding PadR family transcriptional regulator